MRHEELRCFQEEKLWRRDVWRNIVVEEEPTKTADLGNRTPRSRCTKNSPKVRSEDTHANPFVSAIVFFRSLPCILLFLLWCSTCNILCVTCAWSIFHRLHCPVLTKPESRRIDHHVAYHWIWRRINCWWYFVEEMSPADPLSCMTFSSWLGCPSRFENRVHLKNSKENQRKTEERKWQFQRENIWLLNRSVSIWKKKTRPKRRKKYSRIILKKVLLLLGRHDSLMPP